MSKTILFVDDEKAILNSLKREFFDSEFITFYAESGREALKILYENKNIDVIVSDVMMPEMDGYELLKRVKYIYPNIIRIVLSGYVHKALMFKCINENIARIYINKPWVKEDLINKIRDILDTSDKLNDSNLKDILESTNKLPTIPTLFAKINKLIEDDNSSIDEIVTLINKDQTIATKILKTINSAFYGIKTGSVKTAVVNLGLINLKSLIAYVDIFDFDNDSEYKSLLWEHSNLVNTLTVEFYEKINKKKIPEQYSSAGLLHDIGKVILLKMFKEEYESILKMKDENNKVDISICEKNIFHFTHEEVGSYILNLWQLPYPIVEVSLKHSNPLTASNSNKNIACIVNLADYYSWKILHPQFMTNVSNEVYKYLGITKQQCQDIVSKYKESDFRL